ncbi:16S rRNA (cytosine(1402)-N(4))-methyltransferase RsmH [soil metagenome]
MTAFSHIPVLLTEVLSYLKPEEGGVFVDATLGLAGHSTAALAAAKAAGATLQLYGIDQDPAAIAIAQEKLAEYPGTVLIQGNFGDYASLKIPPAKAILMDVGVSSMQIDDPERGFSFMREGILDMRMDPSNGVTASTIVNTWPEYQLANLIYQFGEERLSKKIASAIVKRRKKEPFWKTLDLAGVISEQYPPILRNKHPHPATRTFQALRIEVNRELDVLEKGIKEAYAGLVPGGRLAVISFHSLEDRLVKYVFRELGGKILTAKPVTATETEQSENVRSRSAKMRVIEKQG